MFILPPNCIVPSATSLTISPVFPNFLYFISHTPSAAKESISLRLSAVKIVARVHFRGITAAGVSITGEIIVQHPRTRRRGAIKLRQTLSPMARRSAYCSGHCPRGRRSDNVRQQPPFEGV